MTPSVYVIQKSSGQLYCVTKSHYEKYPHWYDFIGESMTVPEEKPVEDPITPVDIAPSIDIEMVVENKKVRTKRRS